MNKERLRKKRKRKRMKRDIGPPSSDRAYMKRLVKEKSLRSEQSNN